VGTRCADHVTPLYPQKLALTSPTSGGRSVGIVCVRTKATEFFLVFPEKSAVYDKCETCGRARQATDDNITLRRKGTIWMPRN